MRTAWLRRAAVEGGRTRRQLAHELCEREDWRNEKGELCLGTTAPAGARRAQVRQLLVRERHADLLDRDADAPRLIETLTRRDLSTPDLDGRIGSESLLSTFDVDRVEALPFQTGYLSAPWKGAFVSATNNCRSGW